MIDLRQLGELPLRAASGLVLRGGRLWVVSDEELALASFHGETLNEESRTALDHEVLPEEPAERKAAKPDLEALCELPGRLLLALGSGATDRRKRGWLCADGASPVEISLTALYTTLSAELDDLNIEGAAVAGDRLWLAQRGNGADGVNALIELDLQTALDAIASDRALPADPIAITRHDLGEVAGVALSFSDLAALGDGRIAYTAVAEAGDSTYHDGECVGAAIGSFIPGEPLNREPLVLPEPHKVEGIAEAGKGRFLLVADADDPSRPSPLFLARAAL